MHGRCLGRHMKQEIGHVTPLQDCRGSEPFIVLSWKPWLQLLVSHHYSLWRGGQYTVSEEGFPVAPVKSSHATSCNAPLYQFLKGYFCDHTPLCPVGRWLGSLFSWLFLFVLTALLGGSPGLLPFMFFSVHPYRSSSSCFLPKEGIWQDTTHPCFCCSSRLFSVFVFLLAPSPGLL